MGKGNVVPHILNLDISEDTKSVLGRSPGNHGIGSPVDPRTDLNVVRKI
jgi:hypothetical protein